MAVPLGYNLFCSLGNQVTVSTARGVSADINLVTISIAEIKQQYVNISDSVVLEKKVHYT